MSFKKYAAYTSHMDHGIGQLLEALERTCQRENTIIVFSSDNGAINDCPLHGTDKYPGWQEAYPRLGSNAPFRGVKAQLVRRRDTYTNYRQLARHTVLWQDGAPRSGHGLDAHLYRVGRCRTKARPPL